MFPAFPNLCKQEVHQKNKTNMYRLDEVTHKITSAYKRRFSHSDADSKSGHHHHNHGHHHHHHHDVKDHASEDTDATGTNTELNSSQRPIVVHPPVDNEKTPQDNIDDDNAIHPCKTCGTLTSQESMGSDYLKDPNDNNTNTTNAST